VTLLARAAYKHSSGIVEAEIYRRFRSATAAATRALAFEDIARTIDRYRPRSRGDFPRASERASACEKSAEFIGALHLERDNARCAVFYELLKLTGLQVR